MHLHKLLMASLLFMAGSLHAQDGNLNKKSLKFTDISAGPLVFFNSDYSKEAIWINTAYWGADVNMNMSYGYHMFVYTTANAVSTWNGLYLNKAKIMDMYVFYVQDLSAKGGYTGIGYEYSLSCGKLDCLPYLQLNTTTTNMKRLGVSIGILFYTNQKLWDRQKRYDRKHAPLAKG